MDEELEKLSILLRGIRADARTGPMHNSMDSYRTIEAAADECVRIAVKLRLELEYLMGRLRGDLP